jgi:hypothetical protein
LDSLARTRPVRSALPGRLSSASGTRMEARRRVAQQRAGDNRDSSSLVCQQQFLTGVAALDHLGADEQGLRRAVDPHQEHHQRAGNLAAKARAIDVAAILPGQVEQILPVPNSLLVHSSVKATCGLAPTGRCVLGCSWQLSPESRPPAPRRARRRRARRGLRSAVRAGAPLPRSQRHAATC